MIDAFVEGVRSIGQACNLVIIAPVAAVIIAARCRWQAVAAAIGGVVVGGYVFATRWLTFTDAQLRVSALVVIVAVAAMTLASLPHRTPPAWYTRLEWGIESTWTAGAASALVAFVVTLWWRPCVGEELGDILTLAPGEPVGQLLPTIGFMLGVSIPLVIIGLIAAAWAPSERIASWLGVVAGGIGVLLAGSVVVGQHGEIVAKLFEWSQ